MNMNHRSRITGSLIVACLLLFAFTAQAAVTWVGTCTNWYYEPGVTNRMVFELQQGVCEIVPYAADTVRVRWHWDGLWPKDDIALVKSPQDFASFNWTNYTDSGKVYLELPEVLVEVTLTPNFGVNFYDRTASAHTGFNMATTWRWEYDSAYDPVTDGSYYNLRYDQNFPYGYKVKALMEMPDGEAYFGLGQVQDSLNHRGHDIQLWNSDTYSSGPNLTPMYHSLPFFYGVRPAVSGQNPVFSYGIFFNNSSRTVFRYGTEATIPDKYSFEGGDSQIDYFFFAGGADHEMPEVMQRYAELTGTPALLPKWTLGYQTCRWSYDNQTWVEWLAETFANSATSNFPLDCIYLDIDYMNQIPGTAYGDNNLHQLSFNSDFPTPSNMIDYCEARGVKLVPIVEPWINKYHYSLRDEAWTALHFLKDNSGNQLETTTFFGTVSWLDFSSGAARTWWKGKLKGFLADYPFAGIWNDLNEPASVVDPGVDTIPRNGLFYMDGRFGDSTDSRRWSINNHNTYCIYETKTTYEAMQEQFTNRRPMVVGRAAFPGVQQYAMSWTGDNEASWDSLRYSIRNCNNTIISGQANTGDDLGGFVLETNPELLTRWHQKGSLNPLCRNHSQKSASEREPFRYSATYYDAMKKTIEFRYKLLPYLYTLAHDANDTGMPMNAPVVMYHAEDTNTYSTSEYDMMVGEYLLAAPVYTSGATTRSVYLPTNSSWYYWPMGEGGSTNYAGGQSHTVSAPLNVLPMFVKKGAILPMGPRMQHVNEFQPDFLDVNIWPADTQTAFTLYEDDGETLEYQSGSFAETTLTAQRLTNGFVFTSTARTGSYDPYTNGVRNLQVLAYDMEPVLRVKDNGIALTEYADAAALGSNPSGWYYDAGLRRVVVRVPDGQAHTIQAHDSTPPNWTITVSEGTDGSASPNGAVVVEEGSNQTFQITADSLYRIQSVTTNGSAIPVAFTQADTSYPYTWQSIQTNGTLDVTFTPILTTNSPQPVPLVWLHQYYPAETDYEALAVSDSDTDLWDAWKEYIADTDPTLMGSVFLITGRYQIATSPGGTGSIEMQFPASTGRYYQLEYCTDLTNHTIGVSNLGWGISGMVVTNDTTGIWYGAVRALLDAP